MEKSVDTAALPIFSAIRETFDIRKGDIRTYSPLEPCTGEELALLEDTAQLMLKYPTVPCTECQYCMPCPYGLDIPGILLHTK